MAAKGKRNPSHGDPPPSAPFALLDKNDSELYWVQNFSEIQQNDDTGEVIEAARISWRRQGPHEVITGGDWVLVPWDMIRGKHPGQYAKLYKNPANRLAYEHLERARRLLAHAYRDANKAQRNVENLGGPEWKQFGNIADAISALHTRTWDMLPEEIRDLGDRQLPGPPLTFDDFTEDNPLTDAEHQEADTRAWEIARRMRDIYRRERLQGNEDAANYWERQENFVTGAGWAHNQAMKGRVFPSEIYESTSGLEGFEENPVKADGKWHRSTLNDWQGANREPVTLKTHKMATAKGSAECIPYKPRRFESSAALAGRYERRHGQKVPKGTRWLLWVRPAGATDNVTAHKTLDDAKRAGENALRKLPMPNPAARLVNEGLLAGSRPIPSGLDSPRYNEGILAGSRPIPSGLDSPRVNVGIVDPPITRRSKPEQPF